MTIIKNRVSNLNIKRNRAHHIYSRHVITGIAPRTQIFCSNKGRRSRKSLRKYLSDIAISVSVYLSKLVPTNLQKLGKRTETEMNYCSLRFSFYFLFVRVSVTVRFLCVWVTALTFPTFEEKKTFTGGKDKIIH